MTKLCDTCSVSCVLYEYHILLYIPHSYCQSHPKANKPLSSYRIFCDDSIIASRYMLNILFYIVLTLNNSNNMWMLRLWTKAFFMSISLTHTHTHLFIPSFTVIAFPTNIKYTYLYFIYNSIYFSKVIFGYTLNQHPRHHTFYIYIILYIYSLLLYTYPWT